MLWLPLWLLTAALRTWAAQPQALLLESSPGVECRRAADMASLPAHAGELLYQGDTLSTRRGTASVVFCGNRTVYTIEQVSTAVIETGGVRALEGAFHESAHVDECVLPEVDKLDTAEFHRGAWETLELPALPPPAANLTPMARLARAVRLAADNNHAGALAEYAELKSSYWPEQPWLKARIFQQKEDLQPAPAKPHAPAGRTFAIVVGISRYTASTIPPLRYAQADALLFRDFLASSRGGAVPASRLFILTDAEATREKIQAKIDWVLAQKLTAADTLVLFFACHAGPDRKNGSVYLITHNANPEDLHDSAFSFAYLHRLLTSSRARAARVLLFLDTCHAGKLGALPWEPGTVYRAAEKSQQLNPRCLLALAAGPDQLAWEHPRFGGGHGAFTWFLYKGLGEGDADLNHDSTVNSGEMVRFLTPAVHDAVAALRHDQKLVISRNKGPGVPVSFEQQPRFVGSYFDSEILSWLDRAPVKLTAAPAAPPGAGALVRGLAPEIAGEAVVLEYLKGEDVPLAHDDFAHAADSFAAARREVPESLWLEARELFCRGRAAIFEKRYDDAGTLLARAVALDPEAAFAYNALGIAYLERADFDGAQAAFNDTIRRAPYWSYAWHNLALTYTQRGDYRAAERTYRRAVELAPQTAYLHHNLGLLYQMTNRRREAAAEYRRAIDLRPERAESYTALGALRAMERKYKEAETLLRKAMALAPDKPEARHDLAVMPGLWPKRAGEVESLLRWNVGHHPDYLPSRIALARTLVRFGRTNEAIAEYQEILRRAPGYAAAGKELDKLKKQRGR